MIRRPCGKRSTEQEGEKRESGSNSACRTSFTAAGASTVITKPPLRKKSWWGDILSGKTSDEVADEVQQSLGAKFWDVARNWGDELQLRIQDLPIDDACLMPIMPAEVSDALAGMKARSAVGEDQVCVDLLRRLAQEQPEHLCGMCTEVLTNGVLPEPWGVSLLALLPKCQCPALPSDLRPIAMGSAAMKMMSRIVMGRTFDKLREPCRHASSGKGRQPADLIGTFTRLRDVTREWRTGVIAAKLDVKGGVRLHRPWQSGRFPSGTTT